MENKREYMAGITDIRHGFWQWEEGRTKIKCSECGSVICTCTDDPVLISEIKLEQKYCFNCGSLMDRKVNEDG